MRAMRVNSGRNGGDGFASLKKTCYKLGIFFWDYPGDRIGHHGLIPLLPDIVREHAATARAVP